jgi:hypothetical protein
MDRVQQLTTTLRRLQTFRRQYDANRLKYYKQYVGVRDTKLFPDKITARSSVSSRYAYSNVEALVSRVHDAFFAYEDWFECKPRGAQDALAAMSLDMVLKYKLRKAKFTSVFEDVVRNICIYGHAAIKVDWDYDYEVVTKPQAIPLMDPTTGQPVIDPQTGAPVPAKIIPTQVKVPRSCPKFTAIDVFDLLVDPDGHTIVHLTEKTVGQMLREAEVNPQLYYPDALQKLVDNIKMNGKPDVDPMEVLVRLAEIWNVPEKTCSLLTFSADFKENLAYKDQRYSIRTGANITSYKRALYTGDPILLWDGPNPYLHQQPPILHTSYVKLPNEIFGIGAVETISSLADSFDMMLNMISDNWNININKRYAYDTQADIDHDALNNLNIPGGKVGVVGDPTKVIFPLPAFTPASGDYQILPLYKGLIEMTSGISDFYTHGVGSSGGNDTATGISQVISEGNYRFKQFIRNLELDLVQPLLSQCAALCQQFMTDQEEITITDAPSGIKKLAWVQPEELLGAVDFDIVAANYSNNKIIRQRNLMNLAGLLAQSPYIREDVAITALLKAFEVPNADQFVKTPDEMQAEHQANLKEQVELMMLESMLATESKARLQQSKPQTSKGADGRPRTTNPAGPFKGAGLTSEIRSVASDLTGARDLGLGGLGEVPSK